MGDIEQHEKFRRIVPRIAQAPDAAGDADPYSVVRRATWPPRYRAASIAYRADRRANHAPSNRIVLYRDPDSVVDGVLKPVVRRETAHDDQRLAGPLGHASDAGQASQGLIVSPAQRIVCFCQQRGEDDPADAGSKLRISTSRCAFMRAFLQQTQTVPAHRSTLRKTRRQLPRHDQNRYYPHLAAS